MTLPSYRHMTCRTDGDVLVLTPTEPNLQGEEIAQALRDEMIDAAEKTGLSRVVIDFTHAQYMSSTAFRPLLALRRQIQPSNGRIVLCSLSPVIGDIFYTTRLVGDDGVIKPMFEMAPDAETAVALLRGDNAGTP